MTSDSDHAALTFADVESLADLGTYAARARTLDDDGAVRLQATGTVLAAWVCTLPGQGLLGQGVVLGLRTMPLAGEHALDTTVPLAAVSDRMARRASTGDVSAVLAVPPTTASVAWAALTPPRAGWEQVGELSSERLVEVAREGIAAVAQGTPEGAGSAAVTALRRRVWGGTDELDGVPAGAALAAHGLGFARAGDHAVVLRAGAWTRVSLPAGHVLAR